MDGSEFLTALRRYWRVAIAAVVVGAVAAWLTTTTTEPPKTSISYSATAVILNTGSVTGLGPANLETLATLATLDPVVERVADAIGFTGDPRTLAAQVSAATDPTAPGILRITATSAEPQEAATLAHAFASELITYLRSDRERTSEENLALVKSQMRDLSTRIANVDRRLVNASATEVSALQARRTALTNQLNLLASLYQQYMQERLAPDALQIIEEGAPVPNAVSGFQPPRSRAARALIGAVLGLLAGFGIVLALQRFDTRIRTAQTAEQVFRAPVLAEIPRIPRAERGAIVAAEHPGSLAAEAFRLLGASLVLGRMPTVLPGAKRDGSRRGGSPTMFAVTSAAPNEGKSTVVANLAVTLAETGKRVLILSCDFRKPAIDQLFGISDNGGLADALRDPHPGPVLDGCIQATRFEGVSLVPSGSPQQQPGGLLSSQGMRRALREARGKADLVLVDTAPVLAASDAAHLIPEIDAVLVVARAGSTTTRLARRAVEVLERLQAPVIGVALNGARETPVPLRYREYLRGYQIAGLHRSTDGETDVGDSPTSNVTPQGDRL